MASSAFPLVGVELYFEDLPRARAFYEEVLRLELAETQEGHGATVSKYRGKILDESVINDLLSELRACHKPG
jgi:predicted enzyme related to lactoylglutathione lyase